MAVFRGLIQGKRPNPEFLFSVRLALQADAPAVRRLAASPTVRQNNKRCL